MSNGDINIITKIIPLGKWWTPRTLDVFSFNPTISIVAIINLLKSEDDGIYKPHDWAAYIGCGHGQNEKKDIERIIAEWGAKLNETDARHFFPQFKDVEYRE